MDRPITPLSVTSFRSFETSQLGRKATFGPRLKPGTPTRSIGPLNSSKTIDENDKLVVLNNRRGENLSTTCTTLRLSTASLGAVRRSETPTSTITASGSFYSALETEEGDGGGHSRTHVECSPGIFDDCNSISEIADYPDSLSARRDSYDTVAYEPSSAPSSPQRTRAGDDSYHFSSYLSPPPRVSMVRQSTPTSPTDSSALVNKPRLPTTWHETTTTSAKSSLASSKITLKLPRTRYCTYISIHTGVRCNAPTCQLKTLCPVHLHSTGLTRNKIDQHQYRRVKRDDSISKASFGKNQHWCFENEVDSSRRSSPSQTSRTRSPVPHSPSGSLRGESTLRGLVIPQPHRVDSDGLQTASNSPTLLITPPTNHLLSSPTASDEGFTLSSIMIIPSTVCSTSVEGGDRELCPEHPFVENDPIVPGSTVIDWKTNESRRREYEEADRRRKGLWGWLRRRIRSLCCVRDQSEFWDNGKGDGGSVRRYRLVLPEEREKDDDVKPEEPSFASVVATGRSGGGEPCSAPSTPRGLRNPCTWKNPRLEETVLRRASVAGELDWRGLAVTSQTTLQEAKDTRIRSVLEKVDSCESPHYATRSRQSSPLLPRNTLSSPERVGGKSKRLGEERISFWRKKRSDRWSTYTTPP